MRASFHRLSAPGGIRTRTSGLRGRSPGPLSDESDWVVKLARSGRPPAGAKGPGAGRSNASNGGNTSDDHLISFRSAASVEKRDVPHGGGAGLGVHDDLVPARQVDRLVVRVPHVPVLQSSA